MTVSGAIFSGDLGVTLTHEHLLIDQGYWLDTQPDDIKNELIFDPLCLENLWETKINPKKVVDNISLKDLDTAVNEVLRYKKAGGKTIVDVTTIGIGRDVRSLQVISETTGLNIIAGSGYYIEPAHPKGLKNMSIKDISEVIVKDLTVGVDGTDIKAGIIGEIGLSNPIHPDEKKVLKASVIAQIETGVPITIHQPLFFPRGREVLDILEKECADMSRVIIGHMDIADDRSTMSLDYARSLADRGVYVEYDLWGAESYFPDRDYWHPSDAQRIDAVVRLVDEGYLGQVLLSHDICTKIQTTAFGGFGYAHLLRDICPRFQEAGLSDKEIDILLIDNPGRVLPAK